jgi:Putative transposase/Transposase zinc-binding domain
MRPTAEVAAAIDLLGKEVEELGLNVHALKTLRAIQLCRTAALGGHVDKCTDCSAVHISYNSCRNRHCPKCQGHRRVQWIQKREAELLPTVYYHVVFTLPAELNQLCLHQPQLVYNTLFESAWQTIAAFGKNKNVQMGMICIMHTWGQNLSLHPHLHCIVPGGGINAKGHWQKIPTPAGRHSTDKFLFPVKAMSKVFRAKYAANLRKQHFNNKVLLETLFAKNWVVYAKKPFGNPSGVIEYLGRYTHKVAISNQRINEVNKDGITFRYKDYREQGIKKPMHLSLAEFVRRFALHILPHRFVRIRHYGFLSSTWKRKKLKELQQKLNVQIPIKQAPTLLHQCPTCKTGTMVTIEVFGKRGPPVKYLLVTENSACG